MTEEKIRELLNEVKKGNLNIDEAYQRLKGLPFEDMVFAKVDNHREIRQGFPEVVYCKGKTVKQVTGIIKKLNESSSSNVLATRADREMFDAVAVEVPNAEYCETAKLIMIKKGEQTRKGNILVISAGTSDLFVAEEAALTAEVMGNHVERLFDVGVAGIHRLFSYRNMLDEAKVIIVVAGMEGALASVVGGLVAKPVLAVPTSIGYGASFNGLAALLGMLNSCAPGVSVVNIDNGFGAGYTASIINKINEMGAK